MAWQGGFAGDNYGRAEFRAWLRKQKKPAWAKFVTVHNTGAPYTLASVGGAKRMANLANYYRTQNKWKGGPHVFVMEDRAYPGTPIHLTTVHSPSWNGTALAVECEGDFDGTHDPRVGKGKIAWETMAWVFAEICEWMGWPADEKHIMLHREDKKTTHACPGKLITKLLFIELVRRAMGDRDPVTVTAEVPSTPKPVLLPVAEPLPIKMLIVDTPGDTLNMRDAPNGTVKGKLPDKTKVSILKYDGAWAYVQSPAKFKGWVLAKYLKDMKEPVETPPYVPPPPPPPAPAQVQPGKFKASDYCIAWCKKFEGLGPVKNGLTEAYWDVNDYAIGHGHNNGSGIPPAVKKGDKITLEEAERILREADVPPIEKYVNYYVKVPLYQWQVDALIWHIFQQGPGNFRNGKVLPLVNAEKHEEAAYTIEKWPTSNKGLQRRRGVEAARYRGGEPTKW
jgi:GH24 family phage-related lysozyme (muramidase)